MKSDIDRLMEKRGLEALLIVGDESVNMLRVYMTNGAEVTGGYVLKKRGSPAVMIVNAMEVAEAAKSGLEVFTYYDLGWAELLEELKGDQAQASLIFFGRMLQKFNVPAGKIGVYGEGAIHRFIDLIEKVNTASPTYQFVGENGMTIFDEAFQTKDADELLRIRSVAARTSQVLKLTWDFIASHHAEGDQVVDAEGTPLTVGAVKRFVRRTLLDYDLEDSHMIFAPGREGGFPHSRGESDAVLKVGEPIVFDLFPREIGGGYFHDTTRTWSIQYAKPEVQKAYDLVYNAFEVAVDTFRPNMPAKAMQEAVQSYFEENGHPTTRSHPGTTVGYMHSLGHGVGLEIHEYPRIGHLSTDTLAPGNVITIEPGLYYPDQGFGMRLEDTLYVNERGELVTLTDFPKDLILPLRG
ncbi:MAG: M24 family metallopeptidase [Anaerolineae bacterium]